MDLPQRVKKWIVQERLIQQGDHVIAGLSGGGDSVCLLLCLYALKEELGFTLSAVHVHHGIRGGEAEEDAAFSEALCRERQIPFRLFREDVPSLARERGMSLEEAGRTVRYRIFREEQERRREERPDRRARVAVAHHEDDQAETVLMNLCRGTGIRGLGGMPPEQGDIIRPLLTVRRAEIEAWLREQGQPWRTDSTNEDTRYMRSRLRGQLLPWMTEQVNSRSVEHISALAAQARELDRYLEEEAGRWMETFGEISPEGELSLPAAPLLGLPGALTGRILQAAVRKVSGSGKDVTSRHIQALRGLLTAGVGKRTALPGGLTAERGYDRLNLFRRAPREDGTVPADIPPVTEFSIFSRENHEKFPQNRYTKWFDCDKIKNAAEFRHRRTGDVIELKGVGRKTVKSYMIDAKIPSARRDGIWLLADGPDIMWIVGYRMSAAYQVGPETRRILQVSVKGDTASFSV